MHDVESEELRDWCMFAATLLYTPTVIPDTLLIRDCGTRTYALRFTDGQSLQWSEYYLMLSDVAPLRASPLSIRHVTSARPFRPPIPPYAHPPPPSTSWMLRHRCFGKTP
jgi:hypothetical protein